MTRFCTSEAQLRRTEIGSDHLLRIFKLYPILDAKDFASYALRTIAQALQTELKDDDDEYQGVPKRIHVICKALSSSTDKNASYHTLRFNAAMIGSVLLRNKTLASYEVERMAAACRDCIEATVEMSPLSVHLAAAAACREIWLQYQKIKCTARRDRYEDDCFHQQHIRLLRTLTERSHLEARSNILLAANSRLPVELVDHIFDYLLAAEEVPLSTTFTTPSEWKGIDFELALEQFSCGRDIRLFSGRDRSPELLQRMLHHCRDDEEAPSSVEEEPAMFDWMLY